MPARRRRAAGCRRSGRRHDGAWPRGRGGGVRAAGGGGARRTRHAVDVALRGAGGWRDGGGGGGGGGGARRDPPAGGGIGRRAAGGAGGGGAGQGGGRGGGGGGGASPHSPLAVAARGGRYARRCQRDDGSGGGGGCGGGCWTGERFGRVRRRGWAVCGRGLLATSRRGRAAPHPRSLARPRRASDHLSHAAAARPDAGAERDGRRARRSREWPEGWAAAIPVLLLAARGGGARGADGCVGRGPCEAAERLTRGARLLSLRRALRGLRRRRRARQRQRGRRRRVAGGRAVGRCPRLHPTQLFARPGPRRAARPRAAGCTAEGAGGGRRARELAPSRQRAARG